MAEGFLKIGFQSAINVKPLLRAVKRANKAALTAGAREVKKEAKRLVKGRARSKPGQPPAKKSGNLLRSIKSKVGRTVAWVGATKPGGAHGQLMTWGRDSGSKTGRMEPRPFMKPALDNVRATLPAKWKNKL